MVQMDLPECEFCHIEQQVWIFKRRATNNKILKWDTSVCATDATPLSFLFGSIADSEIYGFKNPFLQIFIVC